MYNYIQLDSCVPLPYHTNAMVYQNANELQSIAIVTCTDGHRFPDGHKNKTLECLDDKSWYPEVIPPCLCKYRKYENTVFIQCYSSFPLFDMSC